jgi:toxin ParE1/3/4
MIVVITSAAEADLESIGDWIAEDNPTRALTFVQELRRRCESLIDAPRAYSLVPRYENLAYGAEYIETI